MSEVKQRELIDEIIDNMSTAEFMREFVTFFGAHRATSLIGWAILWGVQGIENGPEFRANLEAQGLSRSTAYRASADYRRFRDELEHKYSGSVSYDRIINKLTAFSPGAVLNST